MQLTIFWGVSCLTIVRGVCINDFDWSAGLCNVA
eukprot:SAG11_NODE_36189_length_263_cov_0.567073_1_plen_33_part_01